MIKRFTYASVTQFVVQDVLFLLKLKQVRQQDAYRQTRGCAKCQFPFTQLYFTINTIW